MTITYHKNVIQRSEEWFALRLGLLTASEMQLIIQPKKLAYADNQTSRDHINELLGQRITKYVEPKYRSSDMLRGYDDEMDAKIVYHENYAPVEDCGFITNDRWGFTIGYSPDGLIGDNLQMECKGRVQKYQIETIMAGEMPDEFRIQMQTGLLVSEREACEFVSYCGGLPMFTKRVEPDKALQDAIIACATEFYNRLELQLMAWENCQKDPTRRLVPTERRIEKEMFL